MILNQCRRLYTFYLEVAHIINSLESMGKDYRKGKNKEYYFERLEFYRDVLNYTTFQRISHLPKISKDSVLLKREARILEANKHDIRVFSTLGTNIGEPHLNIGIFYR